MDTIDTASDTIHLYPDTFYLQDQQVTVDMDQLLLDLIARQSRELHIDSLDSIAQEDTLTIAQRLYLDSLSREMREIDSLRTLNAELVEQGVEHIPTIDVEKSWVKDVEEDRNDVLRAIRDMRTPWRKEATVMLQITQNYVTDNWYQGAVNAFAMLAGVKGKLNYKKGNLSWENVGEWRYGLSSISGDSLRFINTTDDVFRINSKVGYQVHKHLYLSSVAELRTNLMPSWRKNTRELASSFLTPVRFTWGVGIDYKPVKGLDINISPATYKLVYALNANPEQVNVTDYGIEAGKNNLNELGSSVRIDWKWRPVREIIVEANFYFFTNYKRIETELEVDVDFIINRYLSAKVMLHPRYDSTVEIDPTRKTNIQFKEFISIGFSHTFR